MSVDPTTDPVTTDPTTPVVTPPVVTPVPATTLDDFVDSLKREVSLPGQFATDYPAITDDDLLAALMDAFSDAQLDGWFGSYSLDLATGSITPPLSTPGAQLVVLYGGMRWVRIELRSLKTVSRYKAGPVEYEVQQAATVLVALLKDLSARKDALVAAAAVGTRLTYVLDSVSAREYAYEVGRFAPLELPRAMGVLR